jgi:ketosteroid isomerase-like protein
VRALYGDGDTVIVFFDTRAVAKDGRPYENTLSWFLRMQDGAIVEGSAFFDTIELTDLWSRITP